jgi:cellulose synthase operon protein C
MASWIKGVLNRMKRVSCFQNTAILCCVLGCLFLVRGASALPGSERPWEEYLGRPDSREALEKFRQLRERRDPEVFDLLGHAVLLESREQLAQAHQAYCRALAEVWNRIENLERRTVRRLREADTTVMIAGRTEVPEDILDQARWLWTTGSMALQSAARIAPYTRDPSILQNTLESIASAEHRANWPGFHLLQAEAAVILARYELNQGRFESAEKNIARTGLIRDFLWVGPFPNKEEAGYAEDYAPEQEFSLDLEMEGKTGPIQWQTLEPFPRWGFVEFGPVAQPSENAVVYALTFVRSESEQDISVELGHSGAVKVWVGGEWIIGQDAYHQAYPQQIHVPARLSAGWNPILIKLCSKQPEQFGFFLRLTDRQGRPFLPSDPASGLEFWKRGTPAPDGGDFWPVSSEEPDHFNWVRISLDQWLSRERAPLDKALSEWLTAVYLDQHGLLDENDTTSVELLRRAESSYPSSSLIQRWIGLVEKDTNKSLQAFRRAVRYDKNEVAALSELARHYQGQPYKKQMMEAVKEGLGRNPDSARLWFFKAEALHRFAGSPELARRAFRRGQQMSPYYGYGAQRLAQVLQAVQTLEEETRLLEKAFENNRADEGLRGALQQNALARGDVERALHLAQEARVVQPVESRYYADLARYFRAEGEYDRATQSVRQALEITPNSPQVNRLAGEIYLALEDNAQASQYWRRALRIRPNLTGLEEYLERIDENSGGYYDPYRIDLQQMPPVQAEDYPEAQVVVLLDQMVQKVYPDGTSSSTVHLIQKALTDSGVRRLSQHGIYFEPGQERVRIKRARVIREDGTVFDAPPPVERSARGSAASRLYGDYHLQVIQFPSVEKGAVVDLEYEKEQIGRNIYVDYFGSTFFFGQIEPTLLTEYVLITPTEREFYSKVLQPDPRYALPEIRQVEALPGRSGETLLDSGNFYLEQVENDQRVRVWNFTRRPQVQPEPAMPTLSELVPYVKVSTFSTWEEMVKWYWGLIKDQFRVDESLENTTRRLVSEYAAEKGIAVEALSDLEVIQALNAFVNTQIRYLGLEFGIHGYKPHRAVDICNAQYGDCKDKATLMLAMAGIMGIDGRIALLRTSDRGQIDLELPSLGLFNHAIIYFPDIDGRPLILDGTAQFFGTTELPSGDQGVQLLTIGREAVWEFVESPVYTADVNQATYETRLVLQPDGTARGERSSWYSGLFNPSIRNTYHNRGKVREKIEQQFGSAFPGATAEEIKLSDLENFEQPEWIRFQVTLPDFADQPAGQAGRLTFRPVLFPIQLSQSFAAMSRREQELVLQFNFQRNRRLEIQLPRGYQAVQLPAARQLDSPFGRFTMNAKVEDGTLIFEESVRLQDEDLRIAPEEYEAFRQFCVQVDRAEEQQVVLERIEL